MSRTTAPWARLLCALAAVLGLLVVPGAPAPSAHAGTPSAAGVTVSQGAAPVTHDDTDLGPYGTTQGIGILGYRLYSIAVPPNVSVISVDAFGPDGQVAGRIRDTTGDGLPEPFVDSPAAGGFQQLTAVAGSVNRVGGFDGDGNLYGTAGDGTGVDRAAVWRWDNLGEGYYGDPQLVVWEDQVLAGTSTLSVIDANNKGHVLLDDGSVVKGSDGTILKHSGNGSAVHGMNNADVSAGALGVDPDGPEGPQPSYNVPVLWKADGSRVDLPFPPLVYESAQALAVSDDGQVLVQGDWHGTTNGGIEEGIPFRRDRDGNYQALLPPAGSSNDSQVWARDISPSGDIVGETYNKLADGNYNERATVWTGDRAIDMNALVRADERDHLKLTSAFAANDKGMIAGEGTYDSSPLLWLAVPVDPVVFVHGAGASSIYTYRDGQQTDEMLWLGCAADHNRAQLSLDPADIADGTAPVDTRAVDALRHEKCFGTVGEWANPALNVYGTLLDSLVGSRSYREYQRAGIDARQTGEGCDLSQADTSIPNLFVYAYDWREDNARSAHGLARYLECVKKFWPNRKVDIVTHSMGSLVARRYLLDNGGADVDRVITIGGPWLGAPKLVDVLQTGNFAPPAVNGPADVIKHIVGGFPAAHQLMAGRVYGDAASVPVVQENGWDLNGDGSAFQRYTYDDVKALLDDQNPANKPGTTADTFQSYSTAEGGQTDWRADATGVKYTHIVGLQAGAQTIGTVVANEGLVCSGIFTQTCTTQRYISEHMVCGDGTVPLISAERAGHGVDYNDPTAEVLLVRSPNTEQNQSAEHTGMASNPNVDEAILDRLFSVSDQRPAQDHSWLGRPGDDEFSCYQNAATSGLRAAADGTAFQPAAGTSLRYVSLLDGTGLTVTDAHGHTTDPAGDTLGYVQGVTMVPSDRPEAGMAITPLSDTESYTTSFVGTGKPVELTLLEGSQAHPTAATRWVDVPLADGVAAALVTTADGRDTLRVDTDGDGEPDTAVPPTVRLGGSDAADVTAPQVSGSALRTDAGTTYALNATDDASGVDAIMWSTDGTHFARYTEPLTLDASSTPVVTACATDRAGNRSAPYEITLADLEPGLLTTASVDPAPADSGWNAGPVTVHLDAKASTGTSPVASISYRTSGGDEQTVSGATADVAVKADGVSTVTFFATAADGTREVERTLQVRLDTADPRATVKLPAPGAVVDSLSAIVGTATDDASGVTDVEIELRNDAGRYWDGTTWADAQTWLGTSGKTSWSRSTGLPSDGDLPTGAYRLRVQVTDGAGRTGISAPDSFLVAPSAGRKITELAVPNANSTSGIAVNGHGVAVGVTQLGANVVPVRWSGGVMTMLPLAPGDTDGHAYALDDNGTAYGSAAGSGHPNRPVRWSAGADAPTDLDTLAGSGRGEVLGASPDGRTAVGWSADYQPVRWTGTAVEALPLLAGATGGRATGAADDGTVVGWQDTPDGPRAVEWPAGGGVNSLGTVGGDKASRATAVNAFGTVVGTSTDSNGRTHAFVYRDGQLQYLATSFSATSVLPNGVDDAGTVVGEYTDTRGTHAFVAEKDAAAVDLAGTLPAGGGWTTTRAYGVNALGQIIGFGTHGSALTGFLISDTHAPVVDDLDVTTAAGRPVNVALTAYDPDVTDTVTLQLGQAPVHGTLDQLADGHVTYTPAGGFAGTDRFTVVASDGEFASVPGTVTVTVAGDGSGGGSGGDGGGGKNQPPAVELTAPGSGEEGANVQLSASADDPEGDPLTWTWSTDGGVLTADGASASLRLPDGPGEVGVAVSVSDGTTVVTRTAQIRVDNLAPSAAAGPDRTAVWGQPVTLAGSGTDPGPDDTDSLTATWDFGDGSTGTGFAPTHTWAEPGEYEARLTVTDKDGASSTDTAVVTVEQSKGRVIGAVTVREGAAVALVRSDGRTTSGLLTWVGKGRPLVTSVTALGRFRTADGHEAAWLGGHSGEHVVRAYVQAGDRHGRGQVFRLWVDGTEITTSGARTAGLITMS